MSTHYCHAHGCSRAVPARMFACRSHWYALPSATRDAIWREYRNGQEITKTPSLRYLAVQQLAIAQLAFQPNDEKAALAAARHLASAEAYRKRAIDLGHGDPLEGLERPEAA